MADKDEPVEPEKELEKEPEVEEKVEEQVKPLETRDESLEEAALKALEEKSEPAEPEEKPEEKKEEPKEEGYYADEEDEEPPEDTPEQIKEEWRNLTPLQRYLAENIAPLTVRGKIDGRSTSLQVYAVENIPADFEFNSHGDERLALGALSRMDAQAARLEDKFNQEQQQTQATQFSEQENRDIRADIADLQRSGELPLFTPGSNIDEDPKAEVAREALDFYNKENQKRLEESQRGGRLFHRLSYRDAYYLMRAQNPSVGKEQKAEDEERKEITRRAARGGRGASSNEPRKLNLPRTASWDQIINASLGE